MSFFSWQSVGPQIFFIGQILLAVVLGALVGWQREVTGKAAGARTYALISGGAALFTILSLYAFAGSDPSRVASQIVIGVGFLGAGTILHRESRIYGLTTAAGMWVSAAIGMAVGVGFYIVAILGSLLMLGVLMINEDKILNRDNHKEHEQSDIVSE